MSRILSAVACNLDNDILSACLPLMEEAKVEAIEWSFDALYNVVDIPSWFTELLHAYSNEHRLVGHGIFFSMFSGRWMPEQQEWLHHLRQVADTFHFDHVTEHFGFMTGRDFHQGAPLNIPYNNSTLRIGRDRLARIQQACQCPVGLENLAFAYTVDEVKRHGDFLEKLVAPVNGFIILDLHNLYCQLHNFSLSFDEIIKLYPLHRVREVHVSGGSWEATTAVPGKQVRRDTHDDGVPAEVFELLRKTIPLCPHLKFVVLEQLGTGLKTIESRQQFYADFLAMQKVVTVCQTDNPGIVQTFLPQENIVLSHPVEDLLLYNQQRELSVILETADGYEDLKNALANSTLCNTDWEIENWAPEMLETAMKIAQKWK